MALMAGGKVLLKATAALVAEPAGDTGTAVTRAGGFVTHGLAGPFQVTLTCCKKGTAGYILSFLFCGINEWEKAHFRIIKANQCLS